MSDSYVVSVAGVVRPTLEDFNNFTQKIYNTKQKLAPELLVDSLSEWFQNRIFIPGYTPDMWVSEHSELVSMFVSNKNNTYMIAYMQDDGFVLKVQDAPPSKIDVANQVQYFLKLELDSEVSTHNIDNCVMYGCVNGNDTKTLLHLMNNLFGPFCMQETCWSPSIRKNFSTHLHKFMSSLTETCHHSQGNTVLYVPEYPNSDIIPEKPSDVLQHMEALVMYWTRQLKEVISNQNSIYNVDIDVPLDEIRFWKNREADLKSLRRQLKRPEVRSVIEFLVQHNSHFTGEFLQQEALLNTTHQAAKDSLRDLSILIEPCERLALCQPHEIPAIMPLLLNTLRAIWQTSRIFNTPEKIASLMRKVCYQITKECAKSISIQDVLDGDALQVIERLNACIACGDEWQRCYDKTVKAIARDPTCPNWNWDPSQLGTFAQLDALTQRCCHLTEIAEGLLQFGVATTKLSKHWGLTVIGGQRNQDVDKALKRLRTSFLRQMSKLRLLPYDPLNLKATEWHADFSSLKSVLRELELMLANTISMIWDKGLTLSAAIDIIEALYSIAVRQTIKAKVEEKLSAVYALYDVEMKCIKNIYTQQKRDRKPGVYAQYALQSEVLLLRASTAYALIERISKFTPEHVFTEIVATYIHLAEALATDMRALHSDWVVSVIEAANNTAEASGSSNSSLTSRLAVPLFTRHNPEKGERSLIEKAKVQGDSALRTRTVALIPIDVNLDPLLLNVINEANTWSMLSGDFPLPYPAVEVSAKENEIRLLRSRAIEVAYTYNNLVQIIVSQEKHDAGQKGLLDDFLQIAHRIVLPGLMKLHWSEDLEVKDWFLSHTAHKLYVLTTRLLIYRLYQARCYNACKQLANLSLIAIDNKTVHTIESFEQQQLDRQQSTVRLMRGLRRLIASHLLVMKGYFTGQSAAVQQLWYNYVENVDALVTNSLRVSVKRSLHSFQRGLYGERRDEQKSMISTDHPLLEIELWLDNDELRVDVSPTLVNVSAVISKTTRSSTATIYILPRFLELFAQDPAIEALLNSGTGISNSVSLVTSGSMSPTAASTNTRTFRSHYSLVLTEDKEILSYLQQILNAPSIVAADLGKMIAEIDQRYAPIWSVDKTNFMRRYMHSRRTVKSFELDVEHYRNFSKDIAAEDSIRHVGFVRVHCEQLKNALNIHCVQWQQALTQLLYDTTINEMNAVHRVCLNSVDALRTQPDTLDALAEAVAVLQGLQTQFPAIKARYEPLREALETLDRFDIHVSDEEKNLLQSVWRSIQNLQIILVQTAHDLAQRKADVKAELHDAMNAFAQHVLDQRSDLKENGPYNCSPNPTHAEVEAAMKTLKGLHEKLADSRAKSKAMHKGMDVFGIPHPDYKELDGIEQELQLLDTVWSVIRAWLEKWNVWATCPLSKLDPTGVFDDVALFQGKLSKLARSVKQWGVWRSIWAVAQQFKQSLPLIGYLSSPAMRERHWDMLQAEVRSDLKLNADMLTMATVYQLGIQHHLDSVTHISTVAQRELVIETQLNDIANTWSNEPLDIVPYKTRYHKIRTVEALSEKLEAHQLILNTHKNSIFFPNFASDITYWIQTLGDIMETVDTLLQVQTQWMYQDNVISESADIGKQLPKEKEVFSVVSSGWAEAMEQIAKCGRAIDLVTTLRNAKLLERLHGMLMSLDKINQKLDAFLETKRALYPRFYFLANDDLLEMLGQGHDLNVAHKHVGKIFMGMDNFQASASSNNSARGLDIHSVVASDGEVLPLGTTVPLDGEVEFWLKEVDKASSVALQKELLKALSAVQKQNQRSGAALATWIKNSPGQILLLSAQLGWTMRTQLALQESVKSKSSVRKMFNDWQEYVISLTRMVRGDLDRDVRAKVNALTVIEVHHRDVLNRLRSVTQVKAPLQSFDWTSLLRFYYESRSGEVGKCFAKQGNASFPYGYEYQGNSGRLVITPLTDRAYMTMTNALSLVLGCNPQGPAGTGKTETVKDLGKNLGRFVLVFNCTPLMDVATIGRNLAGLSQTGFWGCFDEFNRIEVDVLAVVAQQVSTIFDALRAQKTHFNFQGRMLPLDSGIGLFVTMNPSSKGYAGRSELPENLKALFRPIAMMVPETQLICEIILLSEGFTEAATLARKVVTVYRFMDLQLSKQSHYSYGLRAVKAVLARAGSIARTEDNLDDELLQEQILYRALADMNRAALVPEDQLIFDSVLSDIFLDVQVPSTVHSHLRSEVVLQYRLAGLQATTHAVDKTLQLFESLSVRHGNMLVGDTLSGKSTAWKVLARAITALHARKVALPTVWRVVETLPLNPKSVTTDELYGYYTPTAEWQDGVLAAQVRKACAGARDPTQERWVVLDGPVDTLWIESMNSLLDDNKILTLVNQDRIPIPSNVRILFEVQDLKAASPATVSRCGMIYMSPAKLGWKPYMVSWLRGKKAEWDDAHAEETNAMLGSKRKDSTYSLLTREAIECVVRLVDRFLTPVLQCFSDREDPRMQSRFGSVLDDVTPDNILKEHVPTSVLFKVRNVTRIFDSVVTAANGVDCRTDSGTTYIRLVELYFMFSVIWGVFGGVDQVGRTQADLICRELDTRFPATGSIFDCCVDSGKADWAHWEDKIPGVWKPSFQGAFHKYMVVTADVARMSFLLQHCFEAQQHLLFLGHTGCGKSTIIQHTVNQLDSSKFAQLDVYMTQSTTTGLLNHMISSQLEKRQRTTYGAACSKPTLLLVVDDLTAPDTTDFGSQPALELLRQLLEYKFMTELSHTVGASGHKHIVGLQLLAMLAPPGGARMLPSPRLVSKAVLLNMNQGEDSHIRRMFRTILAAHFLTFDESIRGLAPVVAAATVDLYRAVNSSLLPTPSTPHYQFTLRDVSFVIRGVLRTDSKFTDNKEALGRVWAHECIRVFGDRLNEQHKPVFQGILGNIAMDPRGFDIPQGKIFNASSPILYSDVLSDDNMLTGTGLDQDNTKGLGEYERLPYTDISEKLAEVKTFFVQKLQEFNADPTKQSQKLVFFDAALKHTLNAYRTLSLPRTNLMLVGVGGSGRHSVARMAAYLAQLQIRTIHPGPKYDVRAFRDELKALYRECAIKRSATALLVSDDQLVMDAFYQDLSALALHGFAYNLFTPEELTGLMDDLRSDAQRNNVPLTNESLLAYLIARFRAHFHLILCLSPSDSAFTYRCANYASLFSTCTIQSFAQWPTVALKQVSHAYLAPAIASNANTSGRNNHNNTEVVPLTSTATGTLGNDGFTVFPSIPSLSDLTLREGPHGLSNLSTIFADMHEQSSIMAENMCKTGRVNHITPTKYLDLLSTHMYLLNTKHRNISKAINRLHVSIRKLESTQASVSLLAQELEEKTKASAFKKIQCEKLLVEIQQKQRQADQKRQEVEAEAEKLMIEAIETEERKKFAQIELDKVTPSLEKAVRALEKLTKQAVTEVKSYTKPPKPVEKVMCAVMTILEKEATWASAKKTLSDPNFLHKLKNFEKDKISNATLKAINKYTRHKDFNADDISNVSVAAGALCDWVCAMEMYAKVFRDVQPRRDALLLVDQKLAAKRQQLEAAQLQIEEVAANVGLLEGRYRESIEESRLVEEEAHALQVKLYRARAVVEGLADKRGKWDAQLVQLALTLQTLIADCIMGAGLLVYMGPFTDKLREELVVVWTAILARYNFHTANNFSMTNLLVSPADLNEWSVNTLPTDPYSLNSGVIVQHAPRAPFIIDPQQQAVNWLRLNEADKGLIVADMEAGMDWVNIITKALQEGKPVLLENAPSRLPAVLDPILSLTVFTEASSVLFNDIETAVRKGFRLYLVNSEANPTYRPELAIRCTVVNFAVTQSALEQQMLSLLVSLEEPQLEAERLKLLRDVANDTRHISELEENILTLLGNAQGSLLEDESLVLALTQSKKTESEVVSKLAQTQITSEHQESSRLAYQPCAVRAAMGYFVLADMSTLSPLYQFSLSAYAEVFSRTVQLTRSKQHNEITARVAQIVEAHTSALYVYAASALSELHKLIFAFHLCLSKLHADSLVEPIEVSFLIRGPTLLRSETANVGSRGNSVITSPLPWISNEVWNNVLSLEQLPAFAQLSHSIERNHQEWETWVKSVNPTPDKLAPPGKWQGKKSELHHLLQLRVLRPDCLLNAIRVFVVSTFDKTFIEAPKIDLNEMYSRSSVSTPYLFFLQPGTDSGSLSQIHTLAKAQQTPVQTVSLGRGQQHAAASAIISACAQGTWVHVANLHLLPNWLPNLQRLIYAISMKAQSNNSTSMSANSASGTATNTTDGDNSVHHSGGAKNIILDGQTYKLYKIHPKFRLFLSTQPTNAIPQSLLQTCTKISLEPPLGMKAGMYRLFTSLNDQDLVVPTKPGKYRRIVYNLAWLHCLCVERSRFRGLGWAQPYEFSLNDFTVAQHLLHLEFSREGDEVSWNGLRYLIGQCVYGGRITDTNDRKLLMVLVQQTINEAVYDMKPSHHSSNSNYSGNPVAPSPTNAGNGTSSNNNSASSSTTTTQADNSVAHSIAHGANAFTALPDENTCVNTKDFLKDIRKLAPFEEECVCIFGQHSNAIVAAQRDEVSVVLEGLSTLSGGYMQLESSDGTITTTTSSSSSSSTSNILENTIQYITNMLPKKIEQTTTSNGDSGNAYDEEEPPSLLAVSMGREIAVLNDLLAEVVQDLDQVRLASNGRIALSSRLRDVWNSITVGKCPHVWRKVAHVSESLTGWLAFVLECSAQLEIYSRDDSGRVPVNAGRLFYPKAFFACVERSMMQTAPLNRGSMLLWFLTPVPTSGTACMMCEGSCKCSPIGRVKGIYVENGHWDAQHMCLSEPVPLELYHELPLMQFSPVFRTALQLPKYMVQIPLYTHANRSSDTFIMDVCIMTNNKDPAFWIKRATGILLTAPSF